MNYPRYLTPGDIQHAKEFFGRYEHYTLDDFLNRWDCSLSQVASMLDVKLETVSRWKHQKRKPSKEMLRSLAIADHVMSNRREKNVR